MNKTILVVDDQAHVRFLLEKVLEPLRNQGVLVVTATNGQDALTLVQALHPQLIFLDVMLPRMDGFEVCRQVKQNWGMQEIYVAIVTVKGEETDERTGMAAGANLYLTKPFDPDQILRTAIEVLGVAV